MAEETMSKHGQFAIIPARALDDTRFDKNERYLRALLILGTYADRDGWCYPGLAKIAERLGVTRPTASKTMQDLAEWGYILIVHRPGKDGEGNQSNMYRIIHDAELPVKFAREDGKHPVKSSSVEEKHPVKSHEGEFSNNVPLNVPINGDSKTESPTLPPTDNSFPKDSRELKDPLEYALTHFARVDTAKADPRAEQNEYVKRIAPMFADVMRRRDGKPITEDKQAARRAFEKKIPIAFIDSRIPTYKNGGGEDFRKENATAFWIVNRLEREFAKPLDHKTALEFET